MASFILYIINLFRSGENINEIIEKIKAILPALILNAELLFGDGMGEFQKSDVLNKIMNSAFYLALPDKVKAILNIQTLTDLINTAVEKFKRQQENNNKLKANE